MKNELFFTKGKLNNEIHLISNDDIKNLMEINEKEKLDCERITHNVRNNVISNMDDFYKQIFNNDQKIDGFLIREQHGTVIRQAQREHFYRGENRIFNSSIPLLNRELDKIKKLKEKEVKKLVADMRIYEFKKFIYKFKHVQNWKSNYGGDVLFEILAQHYGIETHWLDITNDFMTALFFATCYYDKDKKEWKPLTKYLTEEDESSKYGMIYHIPRWKNNLVLSIDNHNNYTQILPIGFQPFMRCHMQHGYGLYMENNSPLQANINFEKLKFRHDEQLSQFVYDKMDKGRLIYPHEGLSSFDDIITEISCLLEFQEDSLTYSLNKNKYFKDRYECIKILEKNDINILNLDCISNLTRQRIRKMDKKYENFSIEKNYNINLSTRLIYN